MELNPCLNNQQVIDSLFTILFDSLLLMALKWRASNYWLKFFFVTSLFNSNRFSSNCNFFISFQALYTFQILTIICVFQIIE